MTLLHTSHSRNTRFNFIAPSLFVGLLIGVFILFSPNTLLAQESRPNAAGLTQVLLAQSIRYQQSVPSDKAHLLNDLIQTAVSRQEQLLAIIDENPGEVIRLAVPASMREALPPAVRAYVEQEVEIEGTLEVIDEDHEQYSRLLYYLETAGERLSLHFVDHQPKRLLTGEKIQVKGIRIDNTLALAGGGGKVKPVEPAPVPSTVGELRTLVILVTFQDNPIQPYTAQDAEDAVFSEASDFSLENSYQQAWLGGDVVGWYTIPVASTVCDFNAIASEARSVASASGVDLSAYNHLLYAFPKIGCGGLGMSTVGGNPSQTWIIGTLDLGVVTHELGHALGLWHSHSLDCGTVTLGPSCTVFEYGHPFDAMGDDHSGHYNSFHKERLGWLKSGASAQITTVLTDGTYTLATYEDIGAAPKALKILKSTDPGTGKRTWFYLEARQAIGFDGFLADYSNVLNGVLISTGSEVNNDSSYLLDMSPDSGYLNFQDWSDPALMSGQSFQDPASGVTIKTEWVTATQAAVSVGGLQNPQPDQLTVTVSTDKTSYTRGESVSLSAQVIYNGSPVAKANVLFTITKPGGAVVIGTVSSGTSGTALYKLRLSRTDPVGTYQVSAMATKADLSGSAATTFAVQ